MSTVQAELVHPALDGKESCKGEAYRGPLHFTIPSTGNTQH